MAQKMQTYDEMSIGKGHPQVPQESQLSTPGIPRLCVGNLFTLDAIMWTLGVTTLVSSLVATTHYLILWKRLQCQV